MVFIALGLGMLAALLWAARAFSRSSVASIKALLAWVAALAGLSLAALLFLTGRGGVAVGGLVLAGPLLWRWWRDWAAPPSLRPFLREGAGAGPGAGGGSRSRPAAFGPMSRKDALAVLGLTDPVSDSDVRAAWVRLMQAAHPDHGGSDWLAARVNQAKDVLLSRR